MALLERQEVAEAGRKGANGRALKRARRRQRLEERMKREEPGREPGGSRSWKN
jgi:hypothetical protein